MSGLALPIKGREQKTPFSLLGVVLVKLWISKMADYFHDHDITDDDDKCAEVLEELRSHPAGAELIEEIKDVIVNPPEEKDDNKFYKVKLLLSTRTVKWDGIAPPSDFYYHKIMRPTMPDRWVNREQTMEPFVVSVWLKKLPETIVKHLSGMEGCPAKYLTKMADVIHNMAGNESTSKEVRVFNKETSGARERDNLMEVIAGLANDLKVIQEKCEQMQAIIDTFKTRAEQLGLPSET